MDDEIRTSDLQRRLMTTYHYVDKLNVYVFSNRPFYYHVYLFAMCQHAVGLGDNNLRTVYLPLFNSEVELVTGISSSYKLRF